MDWVEDAFFEKKLKKISKIPHFTHVDSSKITFYRSYGSSSRAYARIWGLPRIWQQALKVKPHYIIEIISERFDKLSDEQKTKTLIHELLHIPQKFSGSLVPHRGNGHMNVSGRVVDKVYNQYKDLL